MIRARLAEAHGRAGTLTVCLQALVRGDESTDATVGLFVIAEAVLSLIRR